MNFSPEAHVPSSHPAITVEMLRRLLEELPPVWKIVGEGARRFLLIDERGNGGGYIQVTAARIDLIDELPELSRYLHITRQTGPFRSPPAHGYCQPGEA